MPRPEKRPMPCCGALVDDVSVVGKDSDARPKAGDLCVCFACGTWGRFVPPCGPADVRLFTPEDLLDPDLEDDQLNLLRAATAAIRRRRGKRLSG